MLFLVQVVIISFLFCLVFFLYFFVLLLLQKCVAHECNMATTNHTGEKCVSFFRNIDQQTHTLKRLFEISITNDFLKFRSSNITFFLLHQFIRFKLNFSRRTRVRCSFAYRFYVHIRCFLLLHFFLLLLLNLRILKPIRWWKLAHFEYNMSICLCKWCVCVCKRNDHS